MISQSPHHVVFSRFPRWKGHVPEGFLADFLGIMTRASFFDLSFPSRRRLESRALSCLPCRRIR